ncbi:MAG TPA: glucosamine-6-phosphate deaminase [Sediminispirochaeta sp.]|nr:glucosamine-6-phosphate deaminase [Sediminispirochaeta sp.]
MIKKFEKKISQAGHFKNPLNERDPYFRSLIEKFEHISTGVHASSTDGSISVAREIAEIIKANEKSGKRTVLALSGETAVGEVYTELIRLHRDEGLSFENTVVFSVMELLSLPGNVYQSYKRYLRDKFLQHINIREEHVFCLDGDMDQESVYRYCQETEKKISAYGGIDYLVLGIGRTGRIGYNEPGSSKNSLTRPVTLDDTSRTELAPVFLGKENVPRRAISLGVRTILGSKEIRLLAWGENKANILKRAIEEKVSEEVAASFLQEHPRARVVIDAAAAAELTRIKTPWLIDQVLWDDRLIRKAVVWLSGVVNKPILKLTDRDYGDHGMESLITEKGVAYNINISVFNDLQHTITGWPGGKPNADDSRRPERKVPFPKRIIIFSPHPDDDVISMGGTMLRLVEHGHDVHVAYQTSGNIAVSDSDVLRYVDFIRDFSSHFSEEGIVELIDQENSDLFDPRVARRIKSLIREGEAKAACRYAGVRAENVHFLNMPFYETGEVEKKPVGPEDIDLVADLIRRVKPHQIYAAGDLSDPHGTHRVCLEAIFTAVEKLRHEKWMEDCWVWLYRGAWQEWDIHHIEMAVPLSPDELKRKRTAIFKHQSQKDGAMFMGDDRREFWQRAEARNRGTAEAYDNLGLAEYEAIEAFVRYEFSG